MYAAFHKIDEAEVQAALKELKYNGYLRVSKREEQQVRAWSSQI